MEKRLLIRKRTTLISFEKSGADKMKLTGEAFTFWISASPRHSKPEFPRWEMFYEVIQGNRRNK